MSEKVITIGNWMLDFHEQWSEWFTACHWYDFTVFELSVCHEKHLGDIEVVLRILGLGLRAQWTYDDNAEGRRIIRERDYQLKAHPEIARDLQEIMDDLE